MCLRMGDTGYQPKTSQNANCNLDIDLNHGILKFHILRHKPNIFCPLAIKRVWLENPLNGGLNEKIIWWVWIATFDYLRVIYFCSLSVREHVCLQFSFGIAWKHQPVRCCVEHMFSLCSMVCVYKLLSWWSRNPWSNMASDGICFSTVLRVWGNLYKI